MKIVIADDEYLVRASLKSMLSELDLPLDIVGEAANGEELVSHVKKHYPDVAFVDIRMPRMGGLEAIKVCKELSPGTHWIILTGFSEFDYAKEAVRLGAASYLLKPVSPEELQEVLDVMFKRSKEYNSILNKEFENELIALVHDLSAIPDDDAGFMSQSQYLCSLFIFDSHLDEKGKSELLQKFLKTVRSVINELSTGDVRFALFPMPNGDLASAGAWGSKNTEQAKSTVKRYFDKLYSIAQKFKSDQFSITVLQSDICPSYKTLHKRLYQLQNLSPLRSIISGDKRLTVEELTMQYESASPDILKLCSLLTKLSSAYKERIYLNYIKTLEEMERVISITKYLNDNNKKSIAEFLAHSVNCNIAMEKDTKVWIKSLHEHAENLLAVSRKEENAFSDIISQVMTYLENNYMLDISIAQIAEQLNITPNYLSSLFHKKVGTTFMKCLTKVRMLKAKELLANPSIQVQQASEKVGYYSTRHFTKLFKEFYDCYPSEYQDKLKK